MERFSWVVIRPAYSQLQLKSTQPKVPPQGTRMPLWVFFFVILTLSISAHCSPSPSLPLRMRRYADAIFTNSYRKILGQLSARKLLQDIMSRQQGERERNQEQGARVRLGRQVDGMWADQKQTALESILVALLQKHRNSQG
ncbi:somatoliberin isoform X2 [Sciurus carolinensis]|uniref:somatoliberin isoform X2 n=1 Tax=Sciurus carolinensis TaxID=30640 RepID=UPI001FB36675|nr:somatoliberin isoform X2 [Sciurus carolinensis]